MDVVAESLELILIPEAMFPESPLPDPPSPVAPPRVADRLLRTAFGQPRLRELFLDPRPADRVIGITGWQGPDRVQVLGEEDDGLDPKRPAHSATHDGLPQQRASPGLGEDLGPPLRDQGEEEHSTWDVSPTVVRH